MGIAVVGTPVRTGSGGSTASPIVLTGVTHTPGNGLVVLVQYQNQTSAAISSISNTPGDTFIPSINSPYVNSGGGGVNRQSCYYCASCTGHATDIVQINFSGGPSQYSKAVCFEISGHDAAAFFIQDAVGSAASGATISSGALTISGNAIVLGIIETDAGAAPVNAAYTLTADDGASAFIWDVSRIVSGNETPSFTRANTGSWGIIAAAFKESGAAPPASVSRLTLLGCG